MPAHREADRRTLQHADRFVHLKCQVLRQTLAVTFWKNWKEFRKNWHWYTQNMYVHGLIILVAGQRTNRI